MAKTEEFNENELSNKNHGLSEIQCELNTLASNVTTTTFTFVCAVMLVAIQHISRIDFDALDFDYESAASGNVTVNMTLDVLEDLSSSFVFDAETSPPFFLTAYSAIYGVVLALLVIITAHRNTWSDFDGGTIMKLYDWTGTIPIIDSVLEIPIALSNEFWTTILLWLGFIIACIALVLGMYWQGDILSTSEDFQDSFVSKSGSDLVILYYSNVYVAYMLLRLTADTSQYFVLLKAQKRHDKGKNGAGEVRDDGGE